MKYRIIAMEKYRRNVKELDKIVLGFLKFMWHWGIQQLYIFIDNVSPVFPRGPIREVE